MRVVKVKSMVTGFTYDELLEKVDKKLCNFFEVSIDELKDKVNYDVMIWESADDGITLPIFSAEVVAQVKKDF
jgi:hypothetical protein